MDGTIGGVALQELSRARISGMTHFTHMAMPAAEATEMVEEMRREGDNEGAADTWLRIL